MMIETGRTTRRSREYMQLYNVAIWFYDMDMVDVACAFWQCAERDLSMAMEQTS